MCGIAGGIALGDSPLDVERVRRMSGLLAHRGPDGHGIWVAPSGRACLAHRRLSVIDLATGAQPIVRCGGSVGLTYNGEIYNYLELRAGMARDGVEFTTTSDTEVLLESYLRAGPAALAGLRGMYAFALWDDRRSELLLARDPIGKKPLFHTVEGGCLYFASTLAALIKTAESRVSYDLEAIDAYLTLGYIPAPRTAFAGFSKLPAATSATLTPDGNGLTLRRFWELPEPTPPPYRSLHEAQDHIREVIEESVAIRLRSDVPLGIFLSGGIDSSLVAAIAARKSREPVRTFSIGFDVPALDESARAQAVAGVIGTQHRTFRGNSDLLDLLPAVVRHAGEPFADATILPLWMLAEQTRQHVTVALGGDGGDEGFAGYKWYGTALRANRLARRVPRWVGAALGSEDERQTRAGRAVRVARLLSLDDAERYAWLREFLHPQDTSWLYAGDLQQARLDSGDLQGARAVTLYREAGGDALQRMRSVDVSTYLADCLMPKLDIATMAHGLEARAPLLDSALLSLAHRIPAHWHRSGRTGKTILRSLLTEHLPADMVSQPKQGFDVPLAAWFSAQQRSRIDALATNGALMDSGWLAERGVRRLVDEHVRGKRDHGERLYTLLVLAEWLGQQ